MRSTICGHEQDDLIWALRTKQALETGWIPFTMGGRISPRERRNVALDAIRDHVKLVELLAEALRERGVDVWLDGAPRIVPPRKDQCALFPYAGALQIYPPTAEDDERSFMLAFAQVRAALLRVLELPQGSTAEDAVKALATNG